MSGSFTPDGGRYVITSYVCPCADEARPSVNVPMLVVRERVVGWLCVNGATVVPMILTSHGLAPVHLAASPAGSSEVGSRRLKGVDDEDLSHAELIALHRGYHAPQRD